MIVALLALFVALGGVGAAATGGHVRTGKLNTAHVYAARAHLFSRQTHFLFALPSVGRVTAMCGVPFAGETSVLAKTRFVSSANGLQVFRDDATEGPPILYGQISRGQAVLDDNQHSGHAQPYHFVYSILGKSGSGHVLATISVFGTGGLGGGGNTRQKQVTAMLQPSNQ